MVQVRAERPTGGAPGSANHQLYCCETKNTCITLQYNIYIVVVRIVYRPDYLRIEDCVCRAVVPVVCWWGCTTSCSTLCSSGGKLRFQYQVPRAALPSCASHLFLSLFCLLLALETLCWNFQKLIVGGVNDLHL